MRLLNKDLALFYALLRRGAAPSSPVLLLCDGAPPPAAPALTPEEGEGIMKGRDLRCLVEIMIIITGMITVLLVRSCDDSVAFTHGLVDTGEREEELSPRLSPALLI